jgi:TRAP-type C4-dicarboxylate transport system permease small subunit
VTLVNLLSLFGTCLVIGMALGAFMGSLHVLWEAFEQHKTPKLSDWPEPIAYWSLICVGVLSVMSMLLELFHA